VATTAVEQRPRTDRTVRRVSVCRTRTRRKNNNTGNARSQQPKTPHQSNLRF
jgi:hypothetical protein